MSPRILQAPADHARRRRRAILAVVLAGTLPLTAAACTGGGRSGPQQSLAGPPYTLRVLASSELADMSPILARARRVTDVTVRPTYIGSLAGTQEVLSGQAARRRYDAIWFANDDYLALSRGGPAKIDARHQIMYSPVILGVQTATARRLGWLGKPVSWVDIVRAAAEHKLTFGMTDPALSNSGFSALASVATVVAGQGKALQANEIPAAEPALRAVFGAQVLKANSSGWLEQAYLRAQATTGTGAPAVDGLIDYESVLLSLNASGDLRQRLTLIYPSDGVITASYPFSLLASAPRAAKPAYTRLADYLLSPAVQRQIDRLTRRRPATPGVRPDPYLRRHPIYELPFPGSICVVDDLLAAYYSKARRPARTIYVLDTSGSMAGARIAGLKRALTYLTGVGAGNGQDCTSQADASLGESFAQFQEREQVVVVPFSTAPGAPITFDIPAAKPGAVLARIRAYADSLTARGWTAIYDALETAYSTAARQAATGPPRLTTIVLLTDGENNRGDGLRAFTAFYHRLPPAIRAIPVFPILFGEARLAQMKAIATLTGGEVFDARTQSLTTVIAGIRSNQ
jgi:Ca-activated chloride channel homolog